MYEKSAVELIFMLSVVLMIYLLVRRPFLTIRLRNRNIKLDTYIIGAFFAPTLIILFGLINYSQIIKGFSGEGSLNPFGILVLFLSMVFMSIYLDITGFFEYCARLALRFSKNSGMKLFFSFYLIISFLTIFTSNDIIILTFTPFIYYFAKHAGVDPLPYLIAEFFAANTWSMMLYIGNPTNIVLASAFHIDFLTYVQWMVGPAVVAGGVNLMLLYLVFRRRIQRILAHEEKLNPRDALTDTSGAVLGVVVLCGCIVALAVAPSLKIDLWYISLGFALALVVLLLLRASFARFVRKQMTLERLSFSKTLRRMPIGIVPFILAMFISIEALRLYGITADIGQWFGTVSAQSSTAGVFLFGVTSTLAANMVNNIPMTVAFVPIIEASASTTNLPAIFATAAGSNLGANLTPLGALAGIMWMTILRNKEVSFSFTEFIKYGLLITPVTLLACLGALAIECLFF